MAEDLYSRVRKLVHMDWDPIGIHGLTDEMGEYDSYIPGLCELLRRGGSEQEIFDYLWEVETEAIELVGDRSATLAFATRLAALASRS